MLKYILKRLFISIFVLLGVSIIIYTLVRMMPNDYLDIKFASQLGQGTITVEQLNEFKAQYGIGDNSFKGLVDGYFTWLTNMLKGDFGTSFKYEKPVAQVIGDNMWVSFAIAVIATTLQFANNETLKDICVKSNVEPHMEKYELLLLEEVKSEKIM